MANEMLRKAIETGDIDAVRGGMFAASTLASQMNSPNEYWNEFVAYVPQAILITVIENVLKKSETPEDSLKADMEVWTKQIEAWKAFVKANEPRIIHGGV
jgi:hypothetical protein